MSSLLGNPHSASSSSQLSTSRIDDIRLRALQFFNADPAEFDLVFIANATAGIKLVADAFRASAEGFVYAYHQASHTSIVGVREEARNSLCLSTEYVANWIRGDVYPFEDFDAELPILFAYPAQSNMDGSRYPLAWSNMARERQHTSPIYTLLDAAAFVSTSPLDLGDSETAPDFTVFSFYKIFGFPDLGGLIVRRQAAPVFDSRKYFGGGTVDMVVCAKEQWHAPKAHRLHERLEDGTLPIHSIIALDSALDVHARLFGTMQDIAAHTSILADRLHSGLSALQHHNGSPICVIYSNRDESSASLANGPVIAFNIRNSQGAWATLAEVDKLAILRQFHIRTGGVCNPGGIAAALDLEPWEMRRNFSAGIRCGQDNETVAGKPTGVIRASLGAMSTISDVDHFIAFIKEFYQEEGPNSSMPLTTNVGPITDLYVARIMVFPIKSCAAYEIAAGTPWQVRAEGLAWDREWCLIHRGSGQALNQKKYRKMALIRPSLDFHSGVLRVAYAGTLPPDIPLEILVSLSNNPYDLEQGTALRSHASQVCGEDISAQAYTSEAVNDFFSAALGVPCMLARFPPGGQGRSMRHAKAHLQRHQSPLLVSRTNPLTCPAPPSPPDSDEDGPGQRILLSNESPILAINAASLAALNQDIVARGGSAVSASAFRANIIVDSSSSSAAQQPYAEDSWSSVRIGRQKYQMLGSCRRCHMVCIDQETAERGQEPFVTLSKTRRFDGKVFFGVHMSHDPVSGSSSGEDQNPTIAVGDLVEIDRHLDR